MSTPQDAPENLNDTLTIKSPCELYELTKEWFIKNNARVMFDYSAKNLSFHTLYRFESVKNVKGLRIPEAFKVLAPGDLELLKTLQHEYLNDCSMEEEVIEFAEPLLIYRGGRSSDIIDHALALETLKAIQYNRSGAGEYELGIAYNPAKCIGDVNSTVKAFVPELEWFDESIRHLKFEDIVKIFPPHEAEMVKLLVGRAVVGRTGSVHPATQSVLTHGFRKAGIIIGEPGIGKTITLNGILDACKFLGYDVAAMGDFGSRFNQGQIVTSHLAYSDDLTVKSLESMLSAHSFKSVVTGGTEKVEAKGVDAIEVVSNTVILANCNEWQPTTIYNLDIGAISRLAPISTYRQFELKSMNASSDHNLHPAVHIEYLANKYDVEPRSLYCKLIKDCADYFLSHTVQHGAEKDVHFKSEQIMPFLRIQMNKNAMDVLVRCAFMAYALRYEKLERVWLPELTLTSLGDVLEALRFLCIDEHAYEFKTHLKKDWEKQDRDYAHYWWCLRKTLITSIDQAYETYIKLKSTKDVALVTEEVFKAIRLNDGVSVAAKVTYIIRTWEKIRGEVDVIYDDARRILSEQQYSNKTIDALSLLDRDLNPICNPNYLYSSSYNPAEL